MSGTTTSYSYLFQLNSIPVAGQTSSSFEVTTLSNGQFQFVVPVTPVAFSFSGASLNTGNTVTITGFNTNLSGSYTGLYYLESPIISVNGVYFLGSNTGNEFSSVAKSVTPVAATTFPCFAAGTQILTELGEVVVEDLKTGDRVVTERGLVSTITWIGHFRVTSADVQLQPVRILADSFGAGRPSRDLFLSPEHAVFVDGVLVPAQNLVNGDTITSVSMGDVDYYHVMLDHHDVILAENLPVESYLPDDDFNKFDNWAGTPAHDLLMMPCAPRITQGARLRAIRDRLDARVRA